MHEEAALSKWEVFVPKSYHARLIGPKGATINRLREVSCGPVGVHDDGKVVLNFTPEARDMLTEILGIPPLVEPYTTVQEFYPLDAHGRIVGSRYTRANEISRESQCFLDISDGCATIWGPNPASCQHAVGLIREAVASANRPAACRENRNQASLLAEERKRLSLAADKAMEYGDREQHRIITSQIRELGDQMSDFNKAARDVLIQREKANGCFDKRVLDLHHFYAKEAAEVASEFVTRLRPLPCTLITGRGVHSKGAKVVRPAVVEALQAMNPRPFVDDKSDEGALLVSWGATGAAGVGGGGAGLPAASAVPTGGWAAQSANLGGGSGVVGVGGVGGGIPAGYPAQHAAYPGAGAVGGVASVGGWPGRPQGRPYEQQYPYSATPVPVNPMVHGR